MSAAGIQESATKIDGEATSIATSIQRLLDQALAALGGADSPVDQPVADSGVA